MLVTMRDLLKQLGMLYQLFILTRTDELALLIFSHLASFQPPSTQLASVILSEKSGDRPGEEGTCVFIEAQRLL